MHLFPSEVFPSKRFLLHKADILTERKKNLFIEWDPGIISYVYLHVQVVPGQIQKDSFTHMHFYSHTFI